jgi:hypothetical protein
VCFCLRDPRLETHNTAWRKGPLAALALIRILQSPGGYLSAQAAPRFNGCAPACRLPVPS